MMDGILEAGTQRQPAELGERRDRAKPIGSVRQEHNLGAGGLP